MMTLLARILLLLVSALTVQPALAQGPPARLATFDAVSVKPNKSGSGDTSIDIDGARYLFSNVSLKSLIKIAYGLQSQEQVSELPVWTNSVNFDIEAKVDAETLATLKAGSKDEKTRQYQGMIKVVLAERFGLKDHPETRELPIYALVVVKGGSKLKDAADPANSSRESSNHTLTATGTSTLRLSAFLSDRLHRVVVDKTGLTGTYDFTLKWSPDEAAGEAPAATGASQLPSLFTALQEQLGLKLESAKGPVDTIVVDKVEMPSEN